MNFTLTNLPMMSSRCTLASLVLLLTLTSALAMEPKDVFKDAAAVWHLGILNASNGITMKAEGAVKLNVELKGKELAESLARGGDGRVAEFDGGWLTEAAEDSSPLVLEGSALTVFVRLRGGDQEWKSGELFSRHGGHSQTLFSLHVNKNEFGFEFGVQEKEDIAKRLAVPLEKIAKGGWHDVIARYDGAKLVLFVDGVQAGTAKVAGSLRSENKQPFTLGKALRGQMDHAAVWTRALSDAEVSALSGGVKVLATVSKERQQEIEKVTGRDDLKLIDKLRATRELREQIAADPLRPRWHLTTPDGVWNDVNGTVYWKGRYHVFFQSLIQPDAATVVAGDDVATNRKEWTHASSADLVHWVYHGTCLRPSFDGTQPKGLYSGDMIDGTDVPTLIYHIPGQGTAIAVAADPTDPELIEWKPIKENPVITLASAPPEVVIFDPTAWKEGDTYYALVGNKNKRPGYEGDTTSLYRSQDLIQWEYRGPLYKSDRKWTTEVEDCACPDFYPIGQGKHMLLMHTHMPFFQAQYYIGTWDVKAERFTPESHGKMNWLGGHLAAPETLLDAKGRRIFWGWVREARKGSSSKGWGSVATLPRLFSLHADATLKIEPAPELESLRYDEHKLTNLQVSSGKEVLLKEVSGDSLELRALIDPGNAKEFGIKVRCSPNGEEETPIVLSLPNQTLRTELVKSGEEGNFKDIAEQVAPMLLKSGEPVRVRVFLDRSIIEIFVNERQCLTQRIYPARRDSLGVKLFTRDGEMTVKTLEAWKLMPVN
jgi:sucrose-6-phosphate hydrolase SacC (GH32 family)